MGWTKHLHPPLVTWHRITYFYNWWQRNIFSVNDGGVSELFLERVIFQYCLTTMLVHRHLASWYRHAILSAVLGGVERKGRSCGYYPYATWEYVIDEIFMLFFVMQHCTLHMCVSAASGRINNNIYLHVLTWYRATETIFACHLSDVKEQNKKDAGPMALPPCFSQAQNQDIGNCGGEWEGCVSSLHGRAGPRRFSLM